MRIVLMIATKINYTQVCMIYFCVLWFALLDRPDKKTKKVNRSFNENTGPGCKKKTILLYYFVKD